MDAPVTSDVLFRLGADLVFVDEAVVVLAADVDAAWPLDTVNEALAHVYGFLIDDRSLAPPQLYTVRDGGADTATLGYLVMARDDRVSDAELAEAFWGMLEATGSADPAARTFVEAPPFCRPGGWDGREVGIVVYPHPYGPPLPVGALNHVLFSLLNQSTWPLEVQQPFMYPVRRADGPRTAGVWIAAGQDGVADDSNLDDNAVRRIRASNEAPKHHWGRADAPNPAAPNGRLAGFEARRFPA